MSFDLKNDFFTITVLNFKLWYPTKKNFENDLKIKFKFENSEKNRRARDRSFFHYNGSMVHYSKNKHSKPILLQDYTKSLKQNEFKRNSD